LAQHGADFFVLRRLDGPNFNPVAVRKRAEETGFAIAAHRFPRARRCRPDAALAERECRPELGPQALDLGNLRVVGVVGMARAVVQEFGGPGAEFQ